MLFKSQLVTQVSGSVGGTTYSHNKSGMYQRARAIPVNPNTSRQVNVRSALTALVTAWSSVLTAAQRSAWNLYAANVPVTNPLGDAVLRSGQQWYIGCNTPRLQVNTNIGTAVLPRVDDAPTTFDRGDFTTPVPTWSEASGLSAAYTNTDDWASEPDSALLFYEGCPVNASRNFFKGPFRLLLGIAAGNATPPTSPYTRTPAELAAEGFAITEGQAIMLKCVVTRADGRLSTPRLIGLNTVGA